jgi:hypothetical protein
MLFKEEADSCRRKADEFAGRPEAPFLLRVASAFDELAIRAEPGVLNLRESAQTASKLHA